MNCPSCHLGNLVSRMATALVVCVALTVANHGWAQNPSYSPNAPLFYYPGAPAGSWAVPATHGQAPGYCPCPPGGFPSYGAPTPYGQYNTPLPEVAPIDDGSTGTDPSGENGDNMPTDELPEVENIDNQFAQAPPSRVPNAIGDSFGPCGELFVDNGLNMYSVAICPAGGRYKATHNNSAVPQSRFYYNFYGFSNAVNADLNGDSRSYDVQRHEAGYEYAFNCNLMSIQLNVPLTNSIDSTIVQDSFDSLPREAELGNVSLALKAVAYQSCYTTFSCGLAVDAPTADDIIIRDSESQFFLNNESVIVSPYVAWLSELSPNVFTQGFIQASIPVNSSTARFDFLATKDCFFHDVRGPSLLYVDLSLGAWMYRDQCTGNGVALLGELHYTTSLSEPMSINVVNPGPQTVDFLNPQRDILNSTLGVTSHYNAWQTTFAYVTPLTSGADKLFDGEMIFQINRLF